MNPVSRQDMFSYQRTTYRLPYIGRGLGSRVSYINNIINFPSVPVNTKNRTHPPPKSKPLVGLHLSQTLRFPP